MNSLKFISIVALASLPIPVSATRISWVPCGNGTIPRECGRFEVPLDYADKQAGTASLAVARLNATVSPRLGTIFLNPGGPGDSGVDWILSDFMAVFLNGTGGQYDLVSWDPRGVGNTIPNVQCFTSMTEETAFWNGSIRGSGLEVRTDFTDPTVRDEFYSHLGEVDSLLVKFGERCNAQSKDMLKYVGTAATVRDMVALSEYLEGDELINYWGISYGTILGNYFVNMFPERVGRVVIDGVVNPWDWATKSPVAIGYSSVHSTDANFDAFASSCARAGPSKCAIAQEGSTVGSIREWVLNLIALAYDNAKITGGSIITSAALRGQMWAALYHPNDWPILAQGLAELFGVLSNYTNSASTIKTRNIPPQFRPTILARRDNANSSDPAVDYSYQAISCADAVDAGNSTTKDGFDAVVNLTNKYTRMFGPLVGWSSAAMFCPRWPVRAVERFTGPFNHKLRNKIIVIGNLYDPITPFKNAQAVADALAKSAVLLQHNGYGHTSIYMHSSCTLAATRKYFIQGKLPQKGTVCETDDQLFP